MQWAEELVVGGTEKDNNTLTRFVVGRPSCSESYNHGQKSWDTFAFLGSFPIHTVPAPPLTPQTMLDACIQNFFRVSSLYRVGWGRTARNFPKGCTVLRGNREITEKYEHCSTVPRTFVQDCRSRFYPSHWSPKGWGIEREGKREGHFPPPPPRLPMPFSAAATQASSPQNSNPRAPRCFSG